MIDADDASGIGIDDRPAADDSDRILCPDTYVVLAISCMLPPPSLAAMLAAAPSTPVMRTWVSTEARSQVVWQIDQPLGGATRVAARERLMASIESTDRHEHHRRIFAFSRLTFELAGCGSPLY